MVYTIKLRQVGESIGGVFPEDVLGRLNVGNGDTLFLVERDGGILLTPRDPKFEKVVETCEDLSKRYQNTLNELAK